MEKVRIDKILSKSGFGSRNDAKALIKQGRVFAEGKKVNSSSAKYFPDDVTVDSEKII